MLCIIDLAGLASHRRAQLSSNVSRHIACLTLGQSFSHLSLLAVHGIVFVERQVMDTSAATTIDSRGNSSMNLVRPRLCPILAAILLVSSAPAQAAVHGETALQNVIVRVEDLDASDLITSTFTVGVGASNTIISLSASDAVNNITASDSWSSSQWMATKSLSVTTAAAHASASVGPNFMNSSGTAVQDGGSFSSSPAAPYFGESSFFLTGHTRLVISGDASITIAMDARSGTGGFTGADEVSASVGIYLFVSPSMRSESGYFLSSYISLPGEHDAVLYNQSQRVIAEIINTSADTVTGRFYAYSSVYGSAAIQAVPEPSQALMLAAGLGLVCWRFRSRGLKSAGPARAG